MPASIRWNGGGPELMLFKLLNGNWTQLGSTYLSSPLAAGSLLNLTVTGSTLSFSVSGAVEITATDTSLTGGAPAIMAYGTPTAGNWSGGDGTYSVGGTYSIGGTVSGLSGTVVLENNGVENQSVSANGTFAFGSLVTQSAPYDVTVQSDPSGQVCTVANGSGTVGSANVTNISITCGSGAFSPQYVSTDANNIQSYSFTSADDGDGSQILRVLVPTHPAAGVAHNFLYVLPVEAGLGSVFGDGLKTLAALDAEDQYNLTIIEPTFAIDPWYANNPNDANLQYETFMTQDLVPWVKAHLAITGSEQSWLIGFSKSGIGGQDLILKHPDLFQLAASWDFPADMSSYNELGTDPAANYGTDANFQADYRLTAAFVNAHKAPFLTSNRIWIGGYFYYQTDVADYDALLTSEGIVHTNGPSQSMAHNWGSGWVPEALAALYRDSTGLSSTNATDDYSFNAAGGSPTPSSGSGLDGTTVTLPGAPTRAGYTFAGWNDGTLIYPAGATYTLSSDGAAIVLTAQWNANATDDYSFNAAGGSPTPSSGSGLDGTTVTLPGAPTRAGYTFAGWNDGTLIYPAGATYTLSSDGAAIVLTAQWNANATITITFNSEGGSAVSTVTGLAGTTITLPAAPSDAGYTFNGWFTAPSGGTALTSPYTLSASTTLYAQWNANATDDYSFNAAGGSPTPSSGSGLDGTTVTLPGAPTRAGYTFAGWNDGTLIYPAGATYTLSSDGAAIVLTAQWNANATITITFNSEGGSAVSTVTGLAGTTITLPAAPSDAGYTFNGWFTAPSGGTALTSPYTLSASTTLYAQWNANATDDYSFNAAGGSPTPSSGSGLDGTTVTLPGAPTRAGYTFAGWNDGTLIYPAGATYTLSSDGAAIVLTAQWNANATITITFNSEGGSAVSTVTGLAGTTITLPAAPSDAGYTFNGWFTAPSGGTALTSPYTLSASTTLYAQWNANATDDYSFNAAGGSPTPSSGSGLDGTTVTLPGAPTRAGYTFAGWNDGTLIYPAGATYTLSSDGAAIVLTAQWNANATITITFNSEGGSAVSTVTGLAGTTITLPAAPSDAGYTFNGWFTAPSGGTALTSPYTLSASTTLYAQWNANATDDYSFNAAGGSPTPSSGSGLDGTTVTLPGAPTRAGYTFAGWNDGTLIYPAGATYTLSSDGAAIVLTAQWNANATITITFNSEGGSAVSTVTGLAGTTITLPAAPSDAGYTFNGWFTAPSGGTALTSPYTLSASTTLYAQWNANATDDYSFNAAGGSPTPSSGSGLDGTTVTLPGAPTRAGYTFAGWNDGTLIYPAGATYTLSSDGAAIVLTAQWNANATITITFNSEGGSAVSTVTGLAGTTITLPAAPSDAGYTFNGWFTAPSGGTALTSPYTLSASTTLYAQWNANATDDYSFNAAGGSPTPSSGSGLDGTTVTLPGAPTRAGYTFAGWNDGTLIYPAGATYTLSSDGAAIVLTAQWNANATITITFNSEGGSAVSTVTGLAGTTITLPAAPSDAGYTFNGWFTAPSGGTALTSPYTLSASTTLYAQWNANATDDYSFNAAGGSPTPSSGSGLDGTTVTLPGAPTRAGYTFAGWNDGTLIYPAGATYTLSSDGAAIVLTAQWNANATITITFNSEGGSAVSTVTGLAGTTITLPAAPSDAGYTFNGWFTAPSGGTALTSPYTLSASTTLYAQWNANPKITITFNSEGGSAVSTVTGLAGTTITLPAAPTYAGYTSNGWFTAPSGGTALTSPYTLSASITLYAQWTANRVGPSFILDAPSKTASVGQAYGYTFEASGNPMPTYALGSGAPSWLSINSTTGLLSGTAPAGTKSFSYEVIASNSVGKATAGPFTVTIVAASPSSSEADLSATLVCPTSVTINITASCALTVHNAGPATAKSVSVTIALPSNVSPVSASGGGVWSKNAATWTLSSLASSSSATFTVTFKPVTPGTVNIFGRTWSPTPDPNYSNNVNVAPVTILS